MTNVPDSGLISPNPTTESVGGSTSSLDFAVTINVCVSGVFSCGCYSVRKCDCFFSIRLSLMFVSVTSEGGTIPV